VRILHPFHPRSGMSFELISHGHHWGEDRVIYRTADGSLPTIAAAFTDLAPVDAFKSISEGRAAFRTQDLIDLAALLERLSASLEGRDA